jgi:hypothetical protein
MHSSGAYKKALNTYKIVHHGKNAGHEMPHLLIKKKNRLEKLNSNQAI